MPRPEPLWPLQASLLPAAPLPAPYRPLAYEDPTPVLDENSAERSRVAPPLSGRYPYCGKAKGPFGGSARAHSALTPRPRRPVLGASYPGCCAQRKALHLAGLHAQMGFRQIVGTLMHIGRTQIVVCLSQRRLQIYGTPTRLN